MGNPVDSNGHITQAALHDFAAGSLDSGDLAAAAEHVAACGRCASALAEIVETEQPVPAGFEEELRNRISREEERKTELFHFSFRVALAASIALFFVFSSAISMLAGPRDPLVQIRAPGFSAIESISTHLRDFSQQILDMEVFKNAEKTK